MAQHSSDQDQRALQQAQHAKARAEQRLLALPGVTGVGVGYKVAAGRRTEEICVRVYVAKKLPLSQLEAGNVVPRTVDGVPTDVIEAVFVAQANPPDPSEHRDRYDPMRCGISIGRTVTTGTGTLGAWATDNATKRALLLSNWHVLCDVDHCEIGDGIVQPGRVDDGRDPEDIVATLFRIGLTNRTDAAIGRLTGARPLRREALGLGPVADIGQASLGLAVRKSGRTTGVTHAIVADVNATVGVVGDYPDPVVLVEDPLLLGRRFAGQIVLEGDHPISDSGDSGSVWIDGSNWLIGLHFAGSPGRALANPMQTVVDTLDISIGLSVLDLLAIEHGQD